MSDECVSDNQVHLRINDANWPRISLQQPQPKQQQPHRTLIQEISDSNNHQQPVAQPKRNRPPPSIMMPRRKDTRKDPSKCTLIDLETMLQRSQTLINNKEIMAIQKDGGQRLIKEHKEIEYHLNLRRQQHKHMTTSSASDSITYIVTQMSGLSVESASQIGSAVAAETIIGQITPTKAQVRAKTSTTPVATRGRVASISIQESIRLQEQHRQQMQEQRLKEAMEKLEKSAASQMASRRRNDAVQNNRSMRQVAVVDAGDSSDDEEEVDREDAFQNFDSDDDVLRHDFESDDEQVSPID